ncbi:hypothetical protein Cflav_PD1677 [Pedosphaera parvula Ellin514]|uniref:Uncharacterized protein n=1 Tax=Pedosphaera parvula (strain Ellin514) TaxID=320771 RepID=B9XMR9_PEDPL|nr:hypothetical protein Cflav_PD1677 [Pedosphaera parvula Ellin514]
MRAGAYNKVLSRSRVLAAMPCLTVIRANRIFLVWLFAKIWQGQLIYEQSA